MNKISEVRLGFIIYFRSVISIFTLRSSWNTNCCDFWKVLFGKQMWLLMVEQSQTTPYDLCNHEFSLNSEALENLKDNAGVWIFAPIERLNVEKLRESTTVWIFALKYSRQGKVGKKRYTFNFLLFIRPQRSSLLKLLDGPFLLELKFVFWAFHLKPQSYANEETTKYALLYERMERFLRKPKTLGTWVCLVWHDNLSQFSAHLWSHVTGELHFGFCLLFIPWSPLRINPHEK